MGTNILIFTSPQNWDPIYLFFEYFFKYIGLWVCEDFGVTDSLDKLGPWLEILSVVVPKLGGGLNPFSLNVQTFLYFSGILVARGLHVQRNASTVGDRY